MSCGFQTVKVNPAWQIVCPPDDFMPAGAISSVLDRMIDDLSQSIINSQPGIAGDGSEKAICVSELNGFGKLDPRLNLQFEVAFDGVTPLSLAKKSRIPFINCERPESG